MSSHVDEANLGRASPAPATREWLTRSVIPADRKLAGVHGLRAIAALMIVVFHTYGIPKLDMPGWLWLVQNRFGLGVHLFFLLSAFSLAHSATMSASDLRTYWIKRFFRIAPFFYVMLVWYQVWFGLKPLSENAINALFVFNLVPALSQGIVWASWTIGVEMIFYAMLPVLLAVAPNRISALCLALAGVAVSVFGRMHLEEAKELPKIYAHLAFISNIGIFCMGIFAYRLYSQSGNRVRDLRLVVAACVALGIVVLGPLRTHVFPGRADVILWALAFGLLTIWQAMRPSFLLSGSVAQFLGERSYSIYLLHPFIIHSLRNTYTFIYEKVGLPGVSFIICAALSIVIVVVCADVTYRLIEAPGIRLGGRLSRYLAKASQSRVDEECAPIR